MTPTLKDLWKSAGVIAAAALLYGCNAERTTTDSTPNRGGPVTEGSRADEQRGGSGADWSRGNGAPGSGSDQD